MIRLKRYSDQPIFSLRKNNPWEAAAVFNAAAIYDNGLVHLVYRATDISSGGQEGPYINALGYAVSKDGIHFNRLEEPILKNDTPQERRGPEDPRIVKIGETFYMMYTGYGGRFQDDYRICLASSRNLIDWKRLGVVLDEPNKDASLFPEKINGQFAMLHRRPPHIWLTFSDNLQDWSSHQPILRALPDSKWENNKIGIAGPPIKTPHGWFLIYHGVDSNMVYRLGAALLDLQNPAKVLYRLPEPILEPELQWERFGHVNNVVFSCGQVVMKEHIFVYYGGADNAIGLAIMEYEDILTLQ
jgi:predicted GH43/DUF377 family glycosyl hydrolase